jgi:hypothetical protein
VICGVKAPADIGRDVGIAAGEADDADYRPGRVLGPEAHDVSEGAAGRSVGREMIREQDCSGGEGKVLLWRFNAEVA